MSEIISKSKQWRLSNAKQVFLNVLQLCVPIALFYNGEVNFIQVTILLLFSISTAIKIRLIHRIYHKGYNIFIIFCVVLFSYLLIIWFIGENSEMLTTTDPVKAQNLDDQMYLELLKNTFLILIIVMSPFIIIQVLPRKKVLVNNRKKIKLGAKFIKILTIFILLFLLICIFITYAFFHLPFFYSDFYIDFTSLVLLYFELVLLLMTVSFLRNIYKNEKLVDDKIIYGSNSILYLRSFNQQNISFWYGKLHKVKIQFIKKLNLISRINVLPDILTFEEFFSPIIKSKNYNLVALGNPNDRLVNRHSRVFYSKDDKWKEKLEELLIKSRGIFFQVGDTDQIQYELQEILNRKFQSKMFILTKPKQSHFHFIFLNKLLLFLTSKKEASWGEFKSILNNSGYKCNLEFYFGAIYFVVGNEIKLLRKGCELPSDYIDVIFEKLNTNGD